MARYVVLHMGKRQIGKPVQDFRVAMQRAYDLLADLDLKHLSRKEIERLRYDIVEM